MAVRPPNPPRGLAQAAFTMAALGAAAVAHSASIEASESSPLMPEPAGYPPPGRGFGAGVRGQRSGIFLRKAARRVSAQARMLRKTAQSLVVELQGPRVLVALQFH